MPSTLQQKFLSLTDILAGGQHFWRPSPFVEPEPAWLRQFPELARQCLELSDGELNALEGDPPAAWQRFGIFIPDAVTLTELTKFPHIQNPPFTLPKRWDVGIPGRKADQVRAFAANIAPRGDAWVDWCSGKAHLGKTLGAIWKMPCIALERDFNLCVEGSRSTRNLPVPAQFINTDVLQVGAIIPSSSHLIALHACGDLHRELVRTACERRVNAVTFAPCCYALWVEGEFKPLSHCAQQNNLYLTRGELRLAVQESVTASPRITAQSHKLAAWRLGFDVLQRQVRQSNTYWNTPSLPLSTLRLGFEQCCRKMAEHTQMDLAVDIDWNYFENQGNLRWAQVRRLQLIRHLYRRALEIWLVLDAALCLEEAEFEVSVGEFCNRALTPRNLLIDARA